MLDHPQTPPAGDESPLPGMVELERAAAGIAVVGMHGEHDLSTAPLLARMLEQAAHSHVIVDFSGCSFIDSSVIAALVKAAHLAQARGEQLVAVIPAESTNVARVAHMIRLSEFIAVYSSRDDAIASLGESHPPTLRDLPS